jgi:hypothetical protein
MVSRLLLFAISSLILFGCASQKDAAHSAPGSSAKPWETVAQQAVSALVRGDGDAFRDVAHDGLARTLRRQIADAVSANPKSNLSLRALEALGVPNSDGILFLNNDEFLKRVIKTPFLNYTGSPRRELTGHHLRVLRSYYMNGQYEVIIQGESKGLIGTNTVVAYVRRQNLDWKYFGDSSVLTMISTPKEVSVRDMAIDAAEKGNYTVLDAREPKREAKGWMVVVMRRYKSFPEAEMVRVFVSDDLQTVKLTAF